MMTKTFQLLVGLLLLVPILIWPASWAACLASFPVGLLIILAWGGLWPWQRRRLRLRWRQLPEFAFLLAFLLLFLMANTILIEAYGGFGPDSFPVVLLRHRVFTALLTFTWLVILIRLALSRTPKARAPAGLSSSPDSSVRPN